MTSAPPRGSRGRPRDEAALVTALGEGLVKLCAEPKLELTIDALVRAAGTSKPRAYRYFASMDALLARVIADAVTRTGRAIREVEATGALDDHAASLLLALFPDDAAAARRIEALAWLRAPTEPSVALALAALEEDAATQLVALFAHAQERRGLRKPYTPESAAGLLSLLRRGAALTPRGAQDVRREASRVFRSLTFGSE